MKEILEALSSASPNIERKLYTILTGSNAGKKILTENGEFCRQTGETDLFFGYREELGAAPDKGCFKALGVRIYTEKVGRQPKLVVCGGGHVAVAVIRIAVLMQINVTVLEDRPLFADHARTAGADRVICDTYERGLAQIPADTEVIASLHAPIGLNIQAETPEEIAVSVMAEIIREKGKRNMGSGFSDEIMKALKDPLNEGIQKVLATIVSRKGSAPRAVGTKMLILQDGRLTGTIGGGCLEAKVITASRELMIQPEKNTALIKVDLTAEEAEEEGMVCGGILEVFLEKIS